MDKKIRIIFNDDGTMTSEAEGFEGANCMAATNKLLECVLAKPTDQKLKEEYYANETNNSISI